MSKQSLKSNRKHISLNTKILIGVMGFIGGYLITKYGMKYSFNQHQEKTIIQSPLISNISTSPSGSFKIRYKDGLTSGKLEIVTPTKPVEVVDIPDISSTSTKFDSKNIAWTKLEDIVIITSHHKEESNTMDSGYIYFISTLSGNLISKHDLGTGSYYGINDDQSFSPVISPNGKYVAVQTDLIHSFSIFDITGNFIAKVPTLFSSTKLFSPAMYELDKGTYSPFLTYNWNAESTSLVYKFQESTNSKISISHTLELSKYLPK